MTSPLPSSGPLKNSVCFRQKGCDVSEQELMPRILHSFVLREDQLCLIFKAGVDWAGKTFALWGWASRGWSVDFTVRKQGWKPALDHWLEDHWLLSIIMVGKRFIHSDPPVFPCPLLLSCSRIFLCFLRGVLWLLAQSRRASKHLCVNLQASALGLDSQRLICPQCFRAAFSFTHYQLSRFFQLYDYRQQWCELLLLLFFLPFLTSTFCFLLSS